MINNEIEKQYKKEKRIYRLQMSILIVLIPVLIFGAIPAIWWIIIKLINFVFTTHYFFTYWQYLVGGIVFSLITSCLKNKVKK